MARLSTKLRSWKSPESEGIAHWCPGCGEAHTITTHRVSGPGWEWDGNVDLPTVTPSVRIFVTDDEDDLGNKLPQPIQQTICHYILTAGVINYWGDCGGHDLSNQKVPLPDFPGEDSAR